jgi:hypothetical protein
MIRIVPLAVTVALLMAPVAIAAPPRNDNYLASLTINAADGSLPPEFHDSLDTTEATTQADTFDPSASGAPLGGGKPEPTMCPGGASFGRTVWYDFVLPVPGAVQLTAAGFDAVIAVYEWDLETSQLGRMIACRNDTAGASEELLLQRVLHKRRNYTIQVGGVNAVGGALDFRFTSFPDRDGDGTLDEQPDSCPRLPGIAALAGCPPVAPGAPRITFDRLAGGIRVTGLAVDRVAAGSRVSVRCKGCGRAITRRARRGGTVRLRSFAGRAVANGDRIEVRITHRRTRSGRFRFGAIGKVVRWPVVGGRLGRRSESCMAPRSTKRTRCP